MMLRAMRKVARKVKDFGYKAVVRLVFPDLVKEMKLEGTFALDPEDPVKYDFALYRIHQWHREDELRSLSQSQED